MINVRKRNGSLEPFSWEKIDNAVKKAFDAQNKAVPELVQKIVHDTIELKHSDDSITDIEDIQDDVVKSIIAAGEWDTALAYHSYREKHKNIRALAQSRAAFIEKYKHSNNTADASIDDNSNVATKNIAVLNTELYKDVNIEVNRYRVTTKLKELYPEFDANQYIKDLHNHIIYKNDENSTFGFPYCVAITMYPFLTNGIKPLGGLSAAPKNIDSFCGMFVNLVFAISSQYAGAVATSEFLMYFDYFARKEWGNNYYNKTNTIISSSDCNRQMTIEKQIDQYLQQICYSINQPSAARGYQAVFWNVSIFDKPFFDGMFGDFYFPDGTQPKWESLSWLQKHFMKWFNKERLSTILTFPVVSVSLIYQNDKFADSDMADFVAEEYSEGDSFFTYISDSVDSLSSCCRLKNKVQTKEFNFTNGNMGVMTGSKSVITLNLNRIVQSWSKMMMNCNGGDWTQERARDSYPDLCDYLVEILDRVYKYHTAYNELLWDLYNANLLPAYKAGFINLNKQYLTVGIAGLTAAAEFLGIKVSNNEEYKNFCQLIFTTIKEQNQLHKTPKTTYNTEMIPAESAGAKLYKWDKEDGFWTPQDINLYTSYVFKPYDENISILDKFILHGKDYIGDYLDGGSANHVNLREHASKEQYKYLLNFAGKVGCQYFTFNIPNCECEDCGFIAKQPFTVCPKCGSTNISLWDRIIGYLTKIKNWSEARREEQKHRVYGKV